MTDYYYLLFCDICTTLDDFLICPELGKKHKDCIGCSGLSTAPEEYHNLKEPNNEYYRHCSECIGTRFPVSCFTFTRKGSRIEDDELLELLKNVAVSGKWPTDVGIEMRFTVLKPEE